jgi:hypothetical protein
METIDIQATEQRNLNEYFKYWRELTADRAVISPSLFLLHDLILGRDPKKSAFTPISNKNKLANGGQRWSGLSKAKFSLWYHSIKNTSPLEKTLIGLSGLTLLELETRLNEVKPSQE